MYTAILFTISLFILQGANTIPLPPKKDAASHQPGLLSRKLMSSISKRSNTEKPGNNSKENSLDSVILAIDTGVKHFMAGKTKPDDVVDKIADSILDFAKTFNSAPNQRSKKQNYDIKPEVVRLRGDKPTVKLEINSQSIIKGLKDLLQSKLVHKYMDKFSKEAAIIYRGIKEEFEKPPSSSRKV